MDKTKNTHAGKAENYDIGRPEYPKDFFDYIYGELGLRENSVIADIGAGTGKIAKEFLGRGSSVFAVEPDKDMLFYLKRNLDGFEKAAIIEAAAENTGIASNATDLIFCGNSYMWFDRKKVVPEFQRIARESESNNIILARLGPGESNHTEALLEIEKRFHKPNSSRPPNIAPPFVSNKFTAKTFEFTFYQSCEQFLHGCLSMSAAPNDEDSDFEMYCNTLANLFAKHSRKDLLEENFNLSCIIGNTKSLDIAS